MDAAWDYWFQVKYNSGRPIGKFNAWDAIDVNFIASPHWYEMENLLFVTQPLTSGKTHYII